MYFGGAQGSDGYDGALSTVYAGRNPVDSIRRSRLRESVSQSHEGVVAFSLDLHLTRDNKHARNFWIGGTADIYPISVSCAYCCIKRTVRRVLIKRALLRRDDHSNG